MFRQEELLDVLCGDDETVAGKFVVGAEFGAVKDGIFYEKCAENSVNDLS